MADKPARAPVNVPFIPDLNQLPCPTTVIDGTSSPVAWDTEVLDGGVQITVTAGSVMPLGTRTVKLDSPIHLPGRGAGGLEFEETDARVFPVLRFVIVFPVDFMRTQAARLFRQLDAAPEPEEAAEEAPQGSPADDEAAA